MLSKGVTIYARRSHAKTGVRTHGCWPARTPLAKNVIAPPPPMTKKKRAKFRNKNCEDKIMGRKQETVLFAVDSKLPRGTGASKTLKQVGSLWRRLVLSLHNAGGLNS